MSYPGDLVGKYAEWRCPSHSVTYASGMVESVEERSYGHYATLRHAPGSLFETSTAPVARLLTWDAPPAWARGFDKRKGAT